MLSLISAPLQHLLLVPTVRCSGERDLHFTMGTGFEVPGVAVEAVRTLLEAFSGLDLTHTRADRGNISTVGPCGSVRPLALADAAGVPVMHSVPRSQRDFAVAHWLPGALDSRAICSCWLYVEIRSLKLWVFACTSR